MYNINTETAATRKEIEIRGRIVMMACDIEFCLLNIIMFCNPSPNYHERAGRFKEMRMAEKINNVIADIKKYKPNYYLEFKDAFGGLEEFRVVRNEMSHHKGDFVNEPDLKIFRISFIDKDGSGIEHLKFKEYTDDYINQAYTKFARINGDLSALWIRLYTEFNSLNHPLANATEESV